MSRRATPAAVSAGAAAAGPVPSGPPTARPIRRTVLAWAGPALVVVAVVAVLHDFAVGGRLSSQHPDVLAYWLPTYCHLGESLASLRVPAWNPFAMAGAPFAADPQSGWMYLPAMALFAALPCGAALRWMIVLQPLLAGVGLYAFLRVERLSRAAAATGAVMLALALASSRLALFLPFPSALAWTTLLLGACGKFLRAGTGPARLGWLLAAAAAWGQLAGAHLAQGLVLGTGAAGAYVVGFGVSRVREGAWSPVRALGTTALLAGAALAVNLAVLVPRLSYLPFSSYGPGYARTVQVQGSLLPPGWPLKLATTPAAYLGLAALALAFAGWWSGRHRRLVLTFTVFGALCYFLGSDLVARPLALRVARLPVLGFYSHYPGRYSLGVLLALPVLAAAGLEAWRARSRPGSARPAVAMLAAGGAVWWALPPLLGASAGQLLVPAVGLVAGLAVLATVRWRPALAWLFPAVLALELAGAAWLGQEGVLRPATPDGRAFGANLTGWFTPLREPRVDPEAYLARGPIARALAARPGTGRFLSHSPEDLTDRGYLEAQAPRAWGLLANQRSMLFRLPEVQGYNPVQLLRFWVFARALADRPLDYNAAVLTEPAGPALDLLEVGWIVAPDGEPPLEGAVPVAREGRWALYRVPSPAPPVSLVSDWRVVEPGGGEDAAALVEVLSPGFDPSRTAVLEDDPGLGRPPGGIGRADVVAREAQLTVVTTESASPAVLVVRTPWDRNWRATVDGRPAPVIPADFLLQGVPVPGGSHTVVLRYDDPSIGYGALGSALAVLGLLGATAVAARRRP